MYIYRVINITKHENDKLNKLAKHFKCTQNKVLEKSAEYLKEIEKINIGVPIRANSNEWTKKNFSLDDKFYTALEDYAKYNFRDIANTIRYLINGCYKVIFKD